MMYGIDFTVIICTRNRRDVLRDTVELTLQRLSPFPNSMLVVVDNCSNDGTAQYLRSLNIGSDRLTVVYEPKPGLYHARVCGIAHARGEYLIFLDDDVLPGDNWPGALIEELAQNPGIGVVGPAIDLVWQGDRPSWMTEHFEREIMGVTGRRSRLEPSIPRNQKTYKFPHYPAGVCLAIRRCDFLQLYSAPERRKVELGPGSSSPRGGAVYGDDWDLSELYIKNGFAVITIDRVRVGHRLLATKLNPLSMLRKFENDGRLRIRYARLAGYLPLSTRVLLILGAFPLLWVCDKAIEIMGLCGPRSLTIQAYSRRARGIWLEFFWGVRGIRFPFHLGNDTPPEEHRASLL